jgi:hypothetical protein
MKHLPSSSQYNLLVNVDEPLFSGNVFCKTQ